MCAAELQFATQHSAMRAAGDPLSRVRCPPAAVPPPSEGLVLEVGCGDRLDVPWWSHPADRPTSRRALNSRISDECVANGRMSRAEYLHPAAPSRRASQSPAGVCVPPTCCCLYACLCHSCTCPSCFRPSVVLLSLILGFNREKKAPRRNLEATVCRTRPCYFIF